VTLNPSSSSSSSAAAAAVANHVKVSEKLV
jgi:hypothetical protein